MAAKVCSNFFITSCCYLLYLVVILKSLYGYAGLAIGVLNLAIVVPQVVSCILHNFLFNFSVSKFVIGYSFTMLEWKHHFFK